jgi:hypothetical protein
MDNPDDLLSDAKVALRYGVHPKTIGRWDERRKQAAERGEKDLTRYLPAPIEINRRKYRRIGELQGFERANVVHSAQPTVQREHQATTTDAA